MSLRPRQERRGTAQMGTPTRRARREIRAAKAELEAEAKAAAAAKAKAQAEAEERRQAEGRKKPGKPAAPPSEEPDPKAREELHRSRKPHHENQGRLHPGLQCAGGGRRDGAGDRRPRPRREAERSTSTGADRRRHRSQSGQEARRTTVGGRGLSLRRQPCGDGGTRDPTPMSRRAGQARGEGEGGGARVAAMRERIQRPAGTRARTA